ARYFDDHFFAGGLTYSGHPLAMAAIVATIDAMKEEKVVENAATIGNEVLRPGLEALAEKHAIIGNVRGRGLFQALELVSSRERKTPLTAADMAAIKGALTEAGLLAFVIHVVPPCTISAEQVAKGLAIFDAVFARFASLAK
ncbi:MAG: aminotransferase class III-fold pyridoxal phosphate-dependent enzyme, partial [Klebsiella michiganensis]|nr:aminotransferase class III-fold pyridoxal phosphate-dependent enzyme [Klebsiella michiganensis]